MFRRGKEEEELWPTPSSVGCIGKGEGERGNRKGRGNQVVEAKLGSQDNSEKAATSLPGASGDLEKNKREKKEVVRPKTLKKANIELLLTQSPTWAMYDRDGLLASSPTR